MRVTLLPPDPRWRIEFECLRDEIVVALDPLSASVEHVGSTAIPCVAKPIIDIAVAVPDDLLDDAARRLTQAMNLVWVSALDEIPPRRRALVKVRRDCGIATAERLEQEPDVRAANITVWPTDSPALVTVLVFRDRLRADLKARRIYEEFKLRLASQTWDSLRAYSLAKDRVIESILSSTGPATSLL